jgi:hypothetical protein
MRSVVARALSGLEMFSGADGKISPAASTGIVAPFSVQEEQIAGAGVVPRKATIREGVYSGLTDGGLFSPVRSSSPQRQSSSGGPLQARVEHKIETLVAAPAAVEEALATLVVDPQDRDLQYSALVTYIKRVYHPYLLREPTFMQHDQILTAAWVYDDPRFANTDHAQHRLGAFLVVPCISELASGLEQLQRDISVLEIGPLSGTLHISVSGKMASNCTCWQCRQHALPVVPACWLVHMSPQLSVFGHSSKSFYHVSGLAWESSLSTVKFCIRPFYIWA